MRRALLQQHALAWRTVVTCPASSVLPCWLWQVMFMTRHLPFHPALPQQPNTLWTEIAPVGDLPQPYGGALTRLFEVRGLHWRVCHAKP